jgi:hypothetical protein
MFGGMSFASANVAPSATIPPSFPQRASHGGTSSSIGDDDEHSVPPPAPPDEEDYPDVVGNSAISANQASISSMFG